MRKRKLRSLLASGLLATLLLSGTNAVLADADAGVTVPAAQRQSAESQVEPAKRSYPDVAPATVEETSPGHYRLAWSGLEGAVTISVAAAPDALQAERRLLARGLEGESASFVIDLGSRPYFHIEDRHGRGWWVAERLLPLEGGRNFRDLDGYLTADGHQVWWGKIFRAGAMADLTAADQNYLAELGLRQVCDLRITIEREQEVAYRDMFRMLVEGDVPLAFNCTAGKDRAGVAAALILSALGVPRETVFADYELSNRYLTADRFLHAKQPESDDEAQTQTPMQQAMSKLPAAAIRAMRVPSRTIWRQASPRSKNAMVRSERSDMHVGFPAG